MAATQTNDNEVIFCLDGEEFFPALAAALDLVARTAAGTPDTYVRMAYWWAVHDCPLDHGMQGLGGGGGGGPITVGDLLEVKLRAVALAGHDADVILFKPSKLETIEPMAASIVDDGLLFQKFDDKWRPGDSGAADPGGAAPGTIRVFLEEYRAWSFGGIAASNHEKITICSINGQRTVFLGGLNLVRSYWDRVAHDRTDGPWHDTAVRICGPATDAIEAEWMRRWRKSNRPITANATVQTTYPAGGLAPHPVNGARGCTVTIATTTSEGATEKDIRRLLVQEIQNAANYVYLENYAFTDPALVAALVARVQQIPAPLAPAPTVIVNIARQGSPYNWLDYVSWAQLAFLTSPSVTVPNLGGGGGNRVINRAGALQWSVIPGTQGWLQDTRIRWQVPVPLIGIGPGMGPGPVETVSISDIQAFGAGGIRFYTPTRAVAGLGGAAKEPIYLHSKLALFDDTMLVVGTANLTYRSMDYDGEMMAFINSPHLAAAVRLRLFAHYNTDGRAAAATVANWDANAASNAGFEVAGTLAAGENYIFTLEMNDYVKQRPTDVKIGRLTDYTWW